MSNTIPLSVKFVGLRGVNDLQFLFQIRGQMDGAVQILPNQGIMFHILDEIFLSHFPCGQIFDPIDRDDADVFNCTEQILEGNQIPVKS